MQGIMDLLRPLSFKLMVLGFVKHTKTKKTNKKTKIFQKDVDNKKLIW